MTIQMFFWLAVILLAFSAKIAQEVRRTKRIVRAVRTRETANKKVPDTFSRGAPALALLLGVVALAGSIVAEIQPGDKALFALFLIPYLIGMGLAGLFDPRLFWAIYPDAVEKMPKGIRILGATLGAILFLSGVFWFVWVSLT